MSAAAGADDGAGARPVSGDAVTAAVVASVAIVGAAVAAAAAGAAAPAVDQLVSELEAVDKRSLGCSTYAYCYWY